MSQALDTEQQNDRPEELAKIILQSDTVDSFRRDLGKVLNRRFELTDMILTASVFHPSFSVLLSISVEQRFLSTKARVQEEYTQLLSESNQPARSRQEVAALDDSDDESRSTLYRIMKQQRIALGPAVSTKDLEDDEVERYFSRLLWWRLNKTKFPMMAQLARNIWLSPQPLSLLSACLVSLEECVRTSAIASPTTK
ncbi:hypothetical protein EDD21DRAFT_431246 [Dissophora ornata]|nr:hypothetical protein EDD21DRAFT_431246 [Dissophora ornata]